MQSKMSYLLGLTAAVMFAPMATAAEASDSTTEKTIVETAAGKEAFSAFVAAVKAADLVEALSSEGPFTLFAPSNEAFDALPEGTVASLLKPENQEKLQALLKYHVAVGKMMAADVVEIDSAKTLDGQRVDVKVSDEGVMIDNGKLTKTDIVCSNGVIHVINKVILPDRQSRSDDR